MQRIACALGLAVAAVTGSAHAADVEVETLVDGLDHPWALAFLDDGDALITERAGALLRVDPASGERSEIAGVPDVDARGQGGLLDIELDPAFDDNRRVYLTWAGECDQGGNATHFGRGTLDGDRLADFETLFVATPCVRSTKHFGSRIVFDDEGHVFVTVGERGERDRAQDLDDHNGSVVRLHPDGSIPADNPFVDRDDARDAIYSYGHRNPQGAAMHPERDELWIHEHGPRGGDEINIPAAGENFGWPEVTFGREYSGEHLAPDHEEGDGFAGPIHHWTPSIAPSGMAFHGGEAFPDWGGDLFVGALALTHLARVELDGTKVVDEERLLDDRGWRIRAVEDGPDGALYLLTDAGDGRLVRLTPAGS